MVNDGAFHIPPAILVPIPGSGAVLLNSGAQILSDHRDILARVSMQHMHWFGRTVSKLPRGTIPAKHWPNKLYASGGIGSVIGINIVSSIMARNR